MVNIDVSTMIKIEHQISGYINGISNTPLVVEDVLERLASLKDRPHICNWFVMWFLHVIIHLWFLDIPGVHPKGRGAVAAVVHQLQGTHCFCNFTISMPRHPASNQCLKPTWETPPESGVTCLNFGDQHILLLKSCITSYDCLFLWGISFHECRISLK